MPQTGQQSLRGAERKETGIPPAARIENHAGLLIVARGWLLALPTTTPGTTSDTPANRERSMSVAGVVEAARFVYTSPPGLDRVEERLQCHMHWLCSRGWCGEVDDYGEFNESARAFPAPPPDRDRRAPAHNAMVSLSSAVSPRTRSP